MRLRVEKALSVRTRATENEQLNKDGSGRDLVWVGGRQYRKATVEGELAVSNHRKETGSRRLRNILTRACCARGRAHSGGGASPSAIRWERAGVRGRLS